MPGHAADRNLLFGILALEMDLITRDALIAAMGAWALSKDRTLGEILVEAGALDPLDLANLDPMIDRKIARQGGDAAHCLAVLRSAGGVAADLRRSIADPDVLDTIATIASIPDDPFATRAASPPGPGKDRVRFRKLREHAAGNLGVVYVARDEELNRDVALKEIKEKNADRLRDQAKFLLEAEVTGGLEHPGIVPVYGLGHHADGRPYYAMRFIRGKSLLAAIRQFHANDALKSDPGLHRLALQELLRRFTDVCNAIAYAHSRGVLHRDLKPDNVMVGKYGETLVVDWGLAKALGVFEGSGSMDDPDDPLPEASFQSSSADHVEATHAGTLVGTPAYMSPEQAAGRLDLLGPASDIYGLGATLYHLLTGRPPIAGTTLPEILANIQAGEFPRPRTLVPWLDPTLEAICRKAMALRPGDRYATPRELARDLDRWSADEPVTAHRESLARRARRWARKHRTAVTAVGSTALVAGLLIGAFLWSSLERTRRADAHGLATLARVDFLEADARKLDDPARYAEAIAEAKRAEAQLESGGDAARSRVRSRLVELQEALRVAESDRKIINDLEEARLLGANVKDDHFDSEGKADAMLAAFRSYGIDLASLSREEAASRVRSSRIATELVVALEEGAIATGGRGEPFATVAHLADADARGADIRDRIGRKDAEGLRLIVAEKSMRSRLGSRCRTIFQALAAFDPAASLPVLESIYREDRLDLNLTASLAEACLKANPPRFESAIRYYYAAAALRPTSSGIFFNLGVVLNSKGEVDAAIDEYREAIRLKPDYASAHHNLGVALLSRGEADAAIAEYREAIRLKPDLAEAHSNLGIALNSRGEVDAAIAECREAIRLEPDLAEAHDKLGVALTSKGELDAAIAAHREAIRLGPGLAEAHDNLGVVLNSKGEVESAIAQYREAIRLKPDHALAHHNLGVALLSRGEIDPAIAESREAIRLKPDLAEAHANLGTALNTRGEVESAIAQYREAIRLKPGLAEAHSNLGADLYSLREFDAAIAECREAVRLKPDFALAHCLLGLSLQANGQFVEALSHLEQGHELGLKTKGWARPSAEWVRVCRHLSELDARLPALLKPGAPPAGPVEGLELADLCYRKGLPAASARFYGQAFVDRPELAEDLDAGSRYNAACAASLAASGAGKDDPRPDDAGRLKLREQALAWLRADLGSREKVLDGVAPKARPAFVQTLGYWKVDADLAGIRDEAALAKLPEGEREGFRAFWADVDRLLAKAKGEHP